MAGSGLPATSGRRPPAVCTAATSDPAPGSRPVGPGIGRVEVRGDERRPRAHAVGGPAQPFEVEVAVPADHDRVGRARRRPSRSRARAAPRPRPGPAHASTRLPAGIVVASSAAAACALVTRSSGSVSTPAAASRSTLSLHAPARVVREEHDAQTGVAQSRDAGRRAVDRRLAAPDHAVQVAADDRTAVARPRGSRLRGSLGDEAVGDDLLERGPVVGVVGPHHRREPQMTRGPWPGRRPSTGTTRRRTARSR